MNVLLLALSTVSNGKLNCFSYQYEDEPSFNGYYQLEPIPKFLNEKLEKGKQEHLSQILYLIFDYPHKHYTFKYFAV